HLFTKYTTRRTSPLAPRLRLRTAEIFQPLVEELSGLLVSEVMRAVHEHHSIALTDFDEVQSNIDVREFREKKHGEPRVVQSRSEHAAPALQELGPGRTVHTRFRRPNRGQPRCPTIDGAKDLYHLQNGQRGLLGNLRFGLSREQANQAFLISEVSGVGGQDDPSGQILKDE